MYVRCCSVQGRLQDVLLCLRYVDTALWLSEHGLCLRGVQEKKSRLKTKASLFVLVFLEAIWLAELMIQLAFVSKKSTSPAVMFISRLVLSIAMTWTEKSACVADLPLSHKHTRARFLLPAVVMVLLLYYGWS